MHDLHGLVRRNDRRAQGIVTMDQGVPRRQECRRVQVTVDADRTAQERRRASTLERVQEPQRALAAREWKSASPCGLRPRARDLRPVLTQDDLVAECGEAGRWSTASCSN
jgi:hypothetical protein